MVVPQTPGIAKCDHCGLWARFRHIASEVQVNRALRQPHEFLYGDVSDQYRKVQAYVQDRGQYLRILDPVGSFSAAAIHWTRIRRSWVHGQFATTVNGTPHWPPRRLLREVKAGTEATFGSAEFWSNERMLY